MGDLFSKLRALGWARLPLWDGLDTNELNLRFPELFAANPIQRASQTLTPSAQADAKPGTMSSFIGLGCQPPHTDKAHFAKPPRYVILRCDETGDINCPTFLWTINWRALERECPRLLTSPEWLVHRSRVQRFYGSVVEFDPGGEGRLRFDPLCMSLPNDMTATDEAMSILLAGATLSQFEWRKGDSLLIDNVRTLHARSGAETGASFRKLSRWISGGSRGLGIDDIKSKSETLWAARSRAAD